MKVRLLLLLLSATLLPALPVQGQVSPVPVCILGRVMSVADAAQKLELPADAVLDLCRRRGMTPAEVLDAPRDALDRRLRRLRLPQPSHPFEAEAWRLLAWRDENGLIPENALLRAREEVSALASGDWTGVSSLSWTPLGPGNIGGRVRCVAPHPTLAGTLFCGSVSGGLWKSATGGASWSVVDDSMANLAITSIVFLPGNPSILYAATGEGFSNSDAIRGAGVFRSSDGGTTWAQMPATTGSSFYFVNRLSAAPNGATLLAATSTGLFRHATAGSSWSAAIITAATPTAFSFGALDVRFHPTNSLVAVADVVGWEPSGSTWFHAIFRTNDGGATFTEVPGTRVNNYWARTEICWHRGFTGAGGGCVYALRNTGGDTLLRSVDGGATFSTVATSIQITGTQGWYDLALWVDPSDLDANPADDLVVAGGIDLWRSTNGGASFTRISQWWSWPGSIHADHHAIVEDPGYNGSSNRRVYFGCDGGVWKTENIATVASLAGWINLNNQLAITQAYGASRSAASGAIIMGTQDAGTLRYTPAGGANAWTTTFGGDGGFCASDPTNSSWHYGEYTNAQVIRSSDGGVSAEYIDGKYWNGVAWIWKSPPWRIDDAMNATANFIAPLALDPSDPNRLYVGGTSLWRTSDARTATTPATGPSWTAVKPPTAASSPISAIAVDPTNANLVLVGHNDGDVYRTTNALAPSPTWTKVDDGIPALPNRMVTRLVVHHPDAPTRIYATFGGFSANNLWVSTTAGSSWGSMIGTPAVPLRDVEPGPGSLPGLPLLYIASEVGLLVTNTSATVWSASLDGPAMVSIDQIFHSGADLYLATHGRGMFRATPTFASTWTPGPGCQYGLAPPLGQSVSIATTTMPVLGQTLTFQAFPVVPGVQGLLFASFVPPAPTTIPGIPFCTVHLDLASVVQIGTFPIQNGYPAVSSYSFLLLDVPSVAGVQVMTQAAWVAANGGFALSNGFGMTLGY